MPESLREAAERLRKTTLATKVKVQRWGISKALTSDQKRQAASPFGAQGRKLNASKILVDFKNEKYKKVSSLCSGIATFWKGLTLPYVEEGIRLISQDRVTFMEEGIQSLTHQLADAASDLNQEMPRIKDEARAMLRDLYNEADYPLRPSESYRVHYSRPSVEPPHYLQTINPEAYTAEMDAFRSKMEQAVVQAEQLFTDELATLVHHLGDKLEDSATGERKVFRDSAINNVRDMIERFRTMNVRNNSDLEEHIQTVESFLGDHTPGAVRSSDDVRQQLRVGMESIYAKLEPLITVKTRRKLSVDVSKIQLVEENAA